MGSQIFSLMAAVVTGIIIADILAHPTGTQQAGNAIGAVTSPAYNALLGVSSSGQVRGG